MVVRYSGYGFAVPLLRPPTQPGEHAFDGRLCRGRDVLQHHEAWLRGERILETGRREARPLSPTLSSAGESAPDERRSSRAWLTVRLVEPNGMPRSHPMKPSY